MDKYQRRHEINEIMILLKKGLTPGVIEDIFEVTNSTINRIRKLKNEYGNFIRYNR